MNKTSPNTAAVLSLNGPSNTRAIQNANLNRGISPNQERGPDGKIRRKPGKVPLVQSPEVEQTWLQALDWAMSHIGKAVETAPSSKALQLWLEGSRSPERFRKQYLPFLIRDEEHRASAQWDGKSDCPVCKRGPEKKIDMSASMKMLDDWWEATQDQEAGVWTPPGAGI
jgi:hypothetical protein